MIIGILDRTSTSYSARMNCFIKDNLSIGEVIETPEKMYFKGTLFLGEKRIKKEHIYKYCDKNSIELSDYVYLVGKDREHVFIRNTD